MPEHAKTLSAVFPLIMRDGQILLHRRQNTGYQDGKWDIAASGHVDEGETAREAAARECREELGIAVQPGDLRFVHLSHRFAPGRVYYDLYFAVQAYEGTPVIAEPEKCAQLQWFPLTALPPDLIPCRRADIGHALAGVAYSEKDERSQ